MQNRHTQDDGRIPGFRLFSGAVLFACANLHPGVPARAQEALKGLNDSGLGGIHAFGAPLAPIALDATGGDERKPPPMIRTDKPQPVKADLTTGSGNLLAKLDLASLHNNLWRTSLSVNLGGRDYWVSGQQSHEGNLNLVLTDKATSRPTFMRDTDLILGHVDLHVGGRNYEVTLKPHFTDVWGSEFTITEGGTTVAAYSIRTVMRAMFESGLAASLDGRSVRISYTDQIFENADGRVSKMGDPLLVLMIEQAAGTYGSEKNKYQGDAVKAADVPHDAFLRTPFKIAPHGVFTLDLKMTDDTRKSLEIYTAGH